MQVFWDVTGKVHAVSNTVKDISAFIFIAKQSRRMATWEECYVGSSWLLLLPHQLAHHLLWPCNNVINHASTIHTTASVWLLSLDC